MNAIPCPHQTPTRSDTTVPVAKPVLPTHINRVMYANTGCSLEDLEREREREK